MKNINNLLLLCCFMISSIMVTPDLKAQIDCGVNTAQTSLRTNDIEVILPGTGGLWWNRQDGGYLIDDPQSTRQIAGIFAGGIWLGGLDPGNNLKFAASTYGATGGNVDFWAGPLTDQGQTEADVCSNYDRFWKVTRTDINALLDDFNDNGTVDNPIPLALRDWPALGNPFFFDINGFDLPNPTNGYRQLAPFFDQNGDGLYDPSKGDYPLIKGAEQAVWWIFNDGGGIHTESTGDAIQAEIHAMAYTYDNAMPPVNRTTFYDYTVINRAVEDIDSTYIGLWIDPDLGCYLDDYVGCNPDKNLFYVYNQDALDDDNACSSSCEGVNGFCDEIPVVGVKILKGTTHMDQSTGNIVDNGLSSLMYYNNGSLAPNPGQTDPTSAIEFYNLLTGTWRDGTPLTTGGTGYNPGSTDVTSYAFPDNPSDPNGWSMCAIDAPGSDARAILGSGPFLMRPGEINSFTFAVYIRDAVMHPCPDLGDFFDDGDLIETFYEGVPTSTYEVASPALGIQFSPNPLRDYSILSIEEGQLQQVDLFSANGQLMRSYNEINNSQLKIERRDLQSGMYFYRLQSAAGKWYSGKLLIQ